MVDINDLTQLPGVGDGTATKLKEGGILTLISVAVCTPGQLKDAAGISEAQARKMIGAARDLCELGFVSGSNIKEQVKLLIPTHNEGIDKLLGGGLEVGTTLEIYGEFASGKSNFGHLLAVSAIKQFPDSYVYFIDTENTFKPSRIEDFCKGLEMDPTLVLSHIRVGKAVSSDHQMLLSENIEKEIVEKKIDVKLIIIDSLTAHFRAEYLGRGTLASRQQMLNGYLHKLSKMASMYNIGIYFTNQIQADPGQMFGDPNKPIGGNIVGHFATTRAYIRKMGKNIRKLILVDSPNLPPGEAVFAIETEKLSVVQ